MADVKSDIEIARAARKKPILEIGGKLGIPPEHLLPYGHDKAKISAEFIAAQKGRPNGKRFDKPRDKPREDWKEHRPREDRKPAPLDPNSPWAALAALRNPKPE